MRNGLQISYRLVVSATLFSLSGIAHAAEPVAMVTDAKGGIFRLLDGKQEALSLLSYMESGQSVNLESGAKISITFFTKPQELTLTGPAKLTIEADGVKVAEGKPAQTRKLAQGKADTARKFTVAQQERVAQASFEMRSAKPINLREPIDTEVLKWTPGFVWGAPPQVQKFHLVLSDDQGKIVQDVVLNKSNWQFPAGATLKAGKSYQWKVDAALPSGESLAATGKFSTADASKSKEILSQQPKAGAPFTDRLFYAMLLESADLKVDARDEWRKLAAERPDMQDLQERANQ